jgi:hypothetical protein
MDIGQDTITFRGSLQTAWEKLIDWRTMHEWDPFMESIEFEGPLAVGSIGKLKIKGVPETKLEVTEFNPPYSYTDQFSMLGSTFIFYHELTELPSNEISLHIGVEVEGALASTIAPLMRKDFAVKMPILMKNFKEQYESAHCND